MPRGRRTKIELGSAPGTAQTAVQMTGKPSSHLDAVMSAKSSDLSSVRVEVNPHQTSDRGSNSGMGDLQFKPSNVARSQSNTLSKSTILRDCSESASDVSAGAAGKLMEANTDVAYAMSWSEQCNVSIDGSSDIQGQRTTSPSVSLSLASNSFAPGARLAGTAALAPATTAAATQSSFKNLTAIEEIVSESQTVSRDQAARLNSNNKKIPRVGSPTVTSQEQPDNQLALQDLHSDKGFVAATSDTIKSTTNNRRPLIEFTTTTTTTSQDYHNSTGDEDEDEEDDISVGNSDDDNNSIDGNYSSDINGAGRARYRTNLPRSPSFYKAAAHSSSRRSFAARLLNRLNIFSVLVDLVGYGSAASSSSSSSNKSQANNSGNFSYTTLYDINDTGSINSGARKYTASRRRRSRAFRGGYRFSRSSISMTILEKLGNVLFHKGTAALFGAFLIHVTLGTIYTLSNINSYLTSYMRQHGSPNATYGGSMWISSAYAIGQGFSMVLGGYLEKRFSARVACVLGCLTHSLSVMATSRSIDYGLWAVLFTYGFLPGFGCGLAYMTPMTNGFGWFPNRKGLVAGTILAGFGLGTFVFNMAQTAYVNSDNLSPGADGYFTQPLVLERVPHLFVFVGTIYAIMQFVGCCLMFKPPLSSFDSATSDIKRGAIGLDERPILVDAELSVRNAVRTREFVVLFFVYGITTQGILFVNSMLKEYGQKFIDDDLYLAWTGSMASVANGLGRLFWGALIDRYSFTQCFTAITLLFGTMMFIMPFEFVLSSKLLYLLCTLGIFGSFSGWMSTYPVHLSRVFGRTNSGMVYGIIFISQSIGGVFTAVGAHYLIDHFNRFVPFFCVVLLELIGLLIYHMFYPK